MNLIQYLFPNICQCLAPQGKRFSVPRRKVIIVDPALVCGTKRGYRLMMNRFVQLSRSQANLTDPISGLCMFSVSHFQILSRHKPDLFCIQNHLSAADILHPWEQRRIMTVLSSQVLPFRKVKEMLRMILSIRSFVRFALPVPEICQFFLQKTGNH